MAGYSYSSGATIVPGNVADANNLTTEFTNLQAAFNNTTGHAHTGSSDDAPPIQLTGGAGQGVSGTLPVANGGTGQTSYTNGQLLVGNTTGNTLIKATLTGTADRVTVTNGAGTITLNVDAASANTANKVVARDGSGNFAAGTITASLTGNVTGNVTGSAATLATARTINGVSFNGSANITIPVNMAASTANSTHYIPFTGSSTAGNNNVLINSNLTYNPSTNTLGLAKVVLGNAGTGSSDAVRADRTVSAGDGLSGGGNLTANRTLAVDSSVVRTSITITAGNGLTGGGSLSANRTVTLGTPGTCSTSTGNSVSSTSHTHAISIPNASTSAKGLVQLSTSTSSTSTTLAATSSAVRAVDLAKMPLPYTGSSSNNGTYPVGTILAAISQVGAIPVNGVAKPSPSTNTAQILLTNSQSLVGNWRARGNLGGSLYIIQRVS